MIPLKELRDAALAMQIVIKFSQEAAEALHGFRQSPEGERLRAMVSDLRLRLEPIDPGTSDPSMRQYFRLEISDEAAASHIVAMLQQDPSVEAAYVKPADELP